MKTWQRRVRGAIGLGVAWAVGWVFVGVLIGVASNLVPGTVFDTFFEVFDAPLPALAMPGFLGGVLFSAVLGVAERGRRVEQLSLARVAAWGAAGGLLLALVPATLVAAGLATANVDVWRLTAMIGVPLTLLGTLSATGSLLVARRAARRGSLDASAGVQGRVWGRRRES